MLHSSAYPSTFPLKDFLISLEPESINGVKSKLASVVVVGEGVGGTGTGVGEGVGGGIVCLSVVYYLMMVGLCHLNW